MNMMDTPVIQLRRTECKYWRALFRYRELFYFFLAHRSCALQTNRQWHFMGRGVDEKDASRE
jgi:hypothetical protein